LGFIKAVSSHPGLDGTQLEWRKHVDFNRNYLELDDVDERKSDQDGDEFLPSEWCPDRASGGTRESPIWT
jgi:hypothetical protein